MNFDIDQQRGLACLIGLIGLIGEGIGFYITGKTPPDFLTGVFWSLAIGPVLTTIVEKYRNNKNGSDDPPSDQNAEGQSGKQPSSPQDPPNMKFILEAS